MQQISTFKKVTIGLLIATLVIVGFNSFQLSQLKVSGVSLVDSNSEMTGSSTTDVIPKGTPDIYGKELGVSFDDVSSLTPQKADLTIRKLATLDQQITLDGDNLKRYIDTVTQISCEYCCGADSIIFSNGQAACGCAHSYAMRGLAKYLIKSHGDEYSNDQVLEELGKWKTLFFPTQMMQKASVLRSKDVELNYINLASNKYRGIEQGVSGDMVGGC